MKMLYACIKRMSTPLKFDYQIEKKKKEVKVQRHKSLGSLIAFCHKRRVISEVLILPRIIIYFFTVYENTQFIVTYLMV